MKTNLLDLIVYTVGLIATVVFFIIFNSPGVESTPETSPEVIGKSSNYSPKVGNGPGPSFQSGITRVAKPAQSAASLSHASSPPIEGSRKTVGISSISTVNHSHQSGTRSGTSDKALAMLTPGEHQGAGAQSPPPSVDDGGPAQSAQVGEISEPLIFTDPGSIISEEPGRDAALLEAAKQLALDLAASGLPPDSPEYMDHWNQTVDLSNQLLRQRYGGQVWMAHHIQSRHLRAASGDED